MLGLPDGVTACLFDMDGVVTRTAVVHDAAWKEMFNDFLRQWPAQTGKEFVPFDLVSSSANTAAVLEAHGADVVVRDLTDLLLFPPGARMRAGRPTGGRCP